MSTLGCFHCWPGWREAEYIANGQSVCSKHMAEYKKQLKVKPEPLIEKTIRKGDA